MLLTTKKAPTITTTLSEALPEELRKEILDLGFPDDGYNYLNHLKEIKNTGGGSTYYSNPKAKLEQLPHDVKHFDEVAQHKYKKDCWIIVSGKVYDVTPFLEEHPGGDEVLLLAADRDATDDFNDVGHSDSAKEMMEKYYVGEIDMSTIPEQPNYKLPAQTTTQADQSSGFVVKLLLFLLPLLILGAAFGMQYYSKKK